jgi:hypothetical protein
MTPPQEQELIDALKSIAASLEQLAHYAIAVTQIKLGITPLAVARLVKNRPRH